MSEDLKELGEHIAAAIDSEIHDKSVTHGELTVIARADRIVQVMSFLRDDPLTKFSVLIDLCGVDYPGKSKRFEVVYHLLSMHNNHRIRVKVAIGESDTVPTITSIYPAADWFEREAFDMFGIVFSGHPDLRRLLTDYNFEGYPLRKDFPLTGHTEVRYDDEQKRVVYEPVSLTQEYRNFDYLSPWEGAKYVLPGDEKADEEGA